MFFRRRPPSDATPLHAGDAAFLNELRAAQTLNATPRTNAALYLMLLFVVSVCAWATIARVNEIKRADGRIVPDGREQIIASLESGILRELHVREGMLVEAGQALAQLDPTRVEAQQKEGRGKRLALAATVARLSAEAAGAPLRFDPELAAASGITAGETALYEARRRALDEGLASTRRSAELLERELKLAESMSAQGLMSDVEVLRLRRQLNELKLQSEERVNRFRQEANGELVRARTELAQLDEQMVVRGDMLRRTVLRSPVRGLVKNIRVATLDGVITAGAPIMEIVPLGPRVLVEARIKPRDIGFVSVGQPVQVKLSAYDYNTYGGLHGRIEHISPDALGESDRAAGGDGTYYRALVVTERSTLRAKGQPLVALPGMTGSVEISVGERTVMSFLLRPLLKAREAFQEG